MEKDQKIISGADDFGCALKDSLVEYLKEKGAEVNDLGTNKYYSVGEEMRRGVSEKHQGGNEHSGNPLGRVEGSTFVGSEADDKRTTNKWAWPEVQGICKCRAF
ncbi:hypothetical protein SUGI_0241740 [Cryptomeria japonica]|nr:hypothetical protein SUGI_0241740 [Cryptomeria japonica]